MSLKYLETLGSKSIRFNSNDISPQLCPQGISFIVSKTSLIAYCQFYDKYTDLMIIDSVSKRNKTSQRMNYTLGIYMCFLT